MIIPHFAAARKRLARPKQSKALVELEYETSTGAEGRPGQTRGAVGPRKVPALHDFPGQPGGRRP